VFPVYDASLVSERTMAVYLHNDVLQLLVEAGWVGFAALTGAFALFMTQMFRRIRRIRRMDAGSNPRRFFLAAGAYAGLTALTVHSVFDFNLQIPANMVYFVMLLAIVSAMSQRGAR
jgi:O-antigen ligase